MYVGMAKISLVIGHAHSLKEKRMVLRRIKDRVRERVSVIINEVGEHDVWQRALLGFAVASGDRQKAHELVEDVVRCVASSGGDIAGISKAVITHDGAIEPVVIDPDRAGSGEKAAGADNWIPDEWREES